MTGTFTKFSPLLILLFFSCSSNDPDQIVSGEISPVSTITFATIDPPADSTEGFFSENPSIASEEIPIEGVPLTETDSECPDFILTSDLPIQNNRVGKVIDFAQMQLRPGGAGNLLVPESWEVDLADSFCNNYSVAEHKGNVRKVWRNPNNKNDAVFYRSSVHSAEDSPPYFDATWDIHSLIVFQNNNIRKDELFKLGSVLEIREVSECVFEFQLHTDDYLLDGTWFTTDGERYVNTYILRQKLDDHEDVISDRFIEGAVSGHFLEFPKMDFLESSPIDYCDAMSNLNVDWQSYYPPAGSTPYNRPAGVDPLNMTLRPECLISNESYSIDEVELLDGFWSGSGEDPDTEKDLPSVSLIRIAYVELIPPNREGREAPNSIESELVLGLMCKIDGRHYPEVHAFSVTSEELIQIGRPISGYLAEIFDSGKNIYHGGTSGGEEYYPERILIVRPQILLDNADQTKTGLCCPNDQYENLYVWTGSDWSAEKRLSKLKNETAINREAVFLESLVFEPLIRMGHSEDCSYYEYTGYVPAQYQDGGVNVSVDCNFRPTGTNINFDLEFEYILRGAGGEENVVDDHVRKQIREILDWWLENMLGLTLSRGGDLMEPTNAYFDLNTTVTFQNDRFYSVKMIFSHFRPWAFNPDPDVATVIVDKISGTRLTNDEIFDPSTNWNEEVSELINSAALIKYPRCSLNYPSESFDPFSLTNTGIRFHLYLTPNACGLGNVVISFEDLDKYLTINFIDTEATQ